MLVIPFGEQDELATEGIAPQRNENAARAFSLECEDEPLDDGQAAILTDRTVAWSDVSLSAPSLEPATPELTTFVTDEVFRPGLRRVDAATEEGANCF